MKSATKQRRGVASVLAMLYLILFSMLALGFFAQVTTSVQLSKNERSIVGAQLAAESGMEFFRYQLSRITLPPATPQNQLLTEVYNDLSDQLDGTSNMAGQTVELSGNLISIPAGTDTYITLDSGGSRFRATMEQTGQQLRVKVVGRQNNVEISRAIQLDYAVAQKASAIFDYGVASRSPIVMNGNTSIKGAVNAANGSVLSTTYRTPAIEMIGNNSISGDISLANPSTSGTLNVSGNSKIAGSSNPAVWANNVHYGVDEPEFPTVITADFAPYATNLITTSSPSGSSFTNIRIKANANPTFSGNTTIKGVVYIETPNKVSFSGNLTLQGVIAVQDNPTGTVTSNIIDFGGNVSFSGVETLPSSYGALRNLKGSMLLAPTFAVKMRGNFGVIGGSVIASKMEFSGNAGGTVKGSIINLEDTAMSLSGNTDIIIESQGTTQYPAGVFFGSNYVPLPDTYEEVQP